MKDLLKARELLDKADYTCVACRDSAVYTATDRGVKPLLNWVEAGLDLTGFSVADRVVGRGAAFLYCLLNVKIVYARIMSRPAAEVLTHYGIAVEAGTFVDGIINRKGTGPCPFEAAVMEITEAKEALRAIQRKMKQMQEGN